MPPLKSTTVEPLLSGNKRDRIKYRGVLISGVEMHARVVLHAARKTVVFREVSSVQRCPHRGAIDHRFQHEMVSNLSGNCQ